MWVGLVYLHSGLLPASELERGAKKKKKTTIKAMFLFFRKSNGTRLTHPRFFFPFGSLFFLSTLPMLRPVVLQHVHNNTASPSPHKQSWDHALVFRWRCTTVLVTGSIRHARKLIHKTRCTNECNLVYTRLEPVESLVFLNRVVEGRCRNLISFSTLASWYS